MTKPDWAERLQRTRKREYDKGWADCEQRIIKLLEEEWLRLEGKEWVTDDFISGFLKTMALIKGEQD